MMRKSQVPDEVIALLEQLSLIAAAAEQTSRLIAAVREQAFRDGYIEGAAAGAPDLSDGLLS
jgi:hypothetical protein